MNIRWLVVFLTMSFTVSAEPAPGVYQHSDDSLQKLYAELHYLNEVGREIHLKYDDKIKQDPLQLRYCMGEYGYIDSRAKATIGIANRLPSEHQQTYISTGWKAYQCIECTGDVSACEAIPPTLKLIEEEYKALHGE